MEEGIRCDSLDLTDGEISPWANAKISAWNSETQRYYETNHACLPCPHAINSGDVVVHPCVGFGLKSISSVAEENRKGSNMEPKCSRPTSRDAAQSKLPGGTEIPLEKTKGASLTILPMVAGSDDQYR